MAEAPSPGKAFYACACFYRENVFLEEYRLHVRYLDEQQFRSDYETVLRNRGCRSSDQFKSVLEKIDKEVKRRRLLAQQSMERKAVIAQCYKPLHPEVYILRDSFLAPEFLEIVKFCTSPAADLEGLLSHIESVSDKRIYCLPLFVPEYCKELMEELENFEHSQMPKGRPNTMNNYGVLLNELGFDDTFVTPLRERYLQPITSLLYPDCGGGCLDSHKAFVVKYSMEEDLDLSCHYDNAEVTLNVCLGKEFTDGNLYFSDMREVPDNERRYAEVEHIVTQGLLHRGQQRHGALPISSGERWNLIVWMRAAAVRNQLCPMCDKEPDLVQTVGFGDGFTQEKVDSSLKMVDTCTII